MVQVVKDPDSSDTASRVVPPPVVKVDSGVCRDDSLSRRATEVPRLRLRGRSPRGDYVPSTVGVCSSWDDHRRGRSRESQDHPRTLSPAPVCSWGTRFASRFRLCSLGVSGVVSGDSSEGSDSKSEAGVSGCGSGRDGGSSESGWFGSKRVEELPPPRAKVVVSEEFPERCPWAVFMSCVTAELRYLCNRLEADNKEPGNVLEEVDDASGMPAGFRVPE